MDNTQMDQTQKSNGALIGSIIIILILVIGGIYLLKTKVSEDRMNTDTTQQEMNDEANNLSDSDDMTDIEADLQSNSNIDYVDQDFK